MASADLTSDTAVEAALLRPLQPNEREHINRLIEQVSERLRDIRPDVDDRIALWAQSPRPETAVSPTVIQGVLGEVISRKLNNPKGLWSTTASTNDGPFSTSTSETYPGARGGEDAKAAGGLDITADDLRKIFRRRGQRAGTIRVRQSL